MAAALRARLSLGIVASVAAVAVLPAQVIDSAARFEVATIKPANPATQYASSGSEGTVWRATGFTLFMLVQAAFPEFDDPERFAAGPSWIRETKFDVQGKAAAVPTAAALNTMVRNLLTDRFGLRTHVERRRLEVYVARLARADGRTGQWLVPTAPECVRQRLAGRPMPDGCDRIERARAAAGGGRALTLRSLTMPTLFAVFRQVGGLDRPVVDRTGLDGFYDVSVQYQSADPLSLSSGGTSLVAAAGDQLGLRFERGREELDILVIDAAERPTPD